MPNLQEKDIQIETCLTHEDAFIVEIKILYKQELGFSIDMVRFVFEPHAFEENEPYVAFLDRKVADEQVIVYRFKPYKLAISVEVKIYITYQNLNNSQLLLQYNRNFEILNPFEVDYFKEFQNRRDISNLFSKFEKFVDRCEKIGFIQGMPSSGKTTFIRRWREKRVSNNGFVLVVDGSSVDETSFYHFVYTLDKSIFIELVNFVSGRNLVDNDTKLKIVDILGLELKGGKYVTESMSKYTLDLFTGHSMFLAWLQEYIRVLFKDNMLFGSFVLVFDNMKKIDKYYIGWMAGYNRSYEDRKVIISISVAIDVIFDEYDLIEFVSINKDIKRSFKMENFGEKDVVSLLRKRVSGIGVEWWERNDMIDILLFLTGGNPQAINSILFHWYKKFVTLSKEMSKDEKIDLLQNVLKSAAKGEMDRRASFLSLWESYRNIIEWICERIEYHHRNHRFIGGKIPANEIIRRYLIALYANHDFDSNISINILSIINADYIDKNNWLKNLKTQYWANNEIIDDLVRCGIVRKRNGRYAIQMPVILWLLFEMRPI